MSSRSRSALHRHETSSEPATPSLLRVFWFLSRKGPFFSLSGVDLFPLLPCVGCWWLQVVSASPFYYFSPSLRKHLDLFLSWAVSLPSVGYRNWVLFFLLLFLKKKKKQTLNRLFLYSFWYESKELQLRANELEDFKQDGRSLWKRCYGRGPLILSWPCQQITPHVPLIYIGLCSQPLLG